MTRMLILVLSFFFVNNSFSKVCFSLKPIDETDFNFNDDIEIESFDGVKLAANIFTPKNKPAPYPTIIFVNSWTLDEHQYIKQAKQLVKKGYQVFSYSTRGWGCSGGYINVIGPKDVKDLGIIVDWLEDNTKVDSKNIGMAGISYGGGMTLMGLAKESRIKTGFAMSAWGSLYEAMYHQETPRLFWSSALMGTGFLLGRVDDVLKEKFKKLIFSKDTRAVQEWANKRSPIQYVDEINKRKAPVFISNNLGDNLFQPNNVWRFFKKLKGPKVLDLNQGTHATGELSGLFTVSNYTFKRLHVWFDYWLRNKKEKSPLQLNMINIQTDLKHKRERLSEEDSKNAPVLSLVLNERKLLSGKMIPKKLGRDTIYSGLDTFASTGIPLISAIVDGHFRIPVYSFMPLIDPLHGLRYTTEKFEKEVRIRGIPKLKLNLDSHEKPFQIIAYLYDVNEFGAGKLITHGAVSGSKIKGEVDLEIVATAYDIPKGHRLALVIDTKDLLYAAKSLKPFKLDLNFDGTSRNYLNIPLK